MIDGDFAVGFFLYLESRGVPVVVLHAYGQELRSPTSDIDFAVPKRDWKSLKCLLKTYCESKGWMLCQSLKHEIRATYFVCSANTSSSRFSLLDGCAEYFVRGHTVIESDEIFRNRRQLDWGGYAPSKEIEICYRFAKACAKRKDPRKVYLELREINSDTNGYLSIWLRSRFRVVLEQWELPAIEAAMRRLSTILERPRIGLAWISLKMQRLRFPKGMYFESVDKLSDTDNARVKRFFRSWIEKSEFDGSTKIVELTKLFGSTIIIARNKGIGTVKRRILKLMGLYVEGGAGEVVDHLARREQSCRN